MKVTVEFDQHDEEEVIERITAAAASRLSAVAREDAERIFRVRVAEIQAEVIDGAVKEMVEAAMNDQTIGLPTMIMERTRFEIQEKLPPRIDQLVKGAITALAAEEARRMEAARPRRGRRWGRRR